MKKKYYFTFGGSENFPFRYTYIIIFAGSFKEATSIFREYYPDKTEGVLNCSFVYTEEEWDSEMEKHFPEGPVKVLNMELTLGELKIIHDSLGEAKNFSKEVRKYFHELSKQRTLTEKEKEIGNEAHNVHVHTDYSRILIQQSNKEIY